MLDDIRKMFAVNDEELDVNGAPKKRRRLTGSDKKAEKLVKQADELFLQLNELFQLHEVPLLVILFGSSSSNVKEIYKLHFKFQKRAEEGGLTSSEKVEMEQSRKMIRALISNPVPALEKEMAPTKLHVAVQLQGNIQTEVSGFLPKQTFKLKEHKYPTLNIHFGQRGEQSALTESKGVADNDKLEWMWYQGCVSLSGYSTISID